MNDPESLLRTVGWLPSSENPWPVPVLDLRSFVSGMLAVSSDQAAATNVALLGGDDGVGFVGQAAPIARFTPVRVRYLVDPGSADGVLFSPTAMEHKWAIFMHDQRLLFVRSWQRRLVATASMTIRSETLEIDSVEGVFTGPEETPSLTAATLDFLIRTHALGQVHPAPFPSDLSSDPKQVALWCFGAFGNRALFATPERWDAPPADQTLRTRTPHRSA